MRKSAGFTLLEIIIVLAIGAVIYTLIPRASARRG